MDEQTISDRARILDAIDAPACDACSAPVIDGAASDARWWVDSEMVRNAVGVAEERAIIRCPACW